MKNTTPKLSLLLERMSQVERMERGKICQMKGRAHYNHQTWQDGRNVVRYIPADQVESLQEAIDGYHLYMELAQKYADQVIEKTRREIAKKSPARGRPKKKG